MQSHLQTEARGLSPNCPVFDVRLRASDLTVSPKEGDSFKQPKCWLYQIRWWVRKGFVKWKALNGLATTGWFSEEMILYAQLPLAFFTLLSDH